MLIPISRKRQENPKFAASTQRFRTTGLHISGFQTKEEYNTLSFVPKYRKKEEIRFL